MHTTTAAPRLAPWLLLALCAALAGWASAGRPLATTRHAAVSPLGSNARNTVLADLNGDGYPDLAVADMDSYQLFNPDPATDSSALSIWLSDPAGTLRCHAQVRGLHANLVAGADLDQDGDVDLITGDSQGDYLLVLLNDGRAHYRRASRLPAARPHNFVLGDMNNDGVPDLVLKGDSCSIAVGYNDGHAHFRMKTQGLGPLFPEDKNSGQPYADRHGYCPREVALADVDRDGDLDIVTVNDQGVYQPTTLSVIYNDGAHGKLELEELVYPANYVANLTIGDLNGDGWPDLVLAGLGDSYDYPNIVFILLNDTHGRYGTSNITMGGLDNGPADERFGPTLVRRLSTGELDAWRVALGDVDADGDLDLVVAGRYGQLGVLRNNGHATFADLYCLPTRPAHQAELPIGDLRGRGQLAWLVPHRPLPLPGGAARVGDTAVLDKLR